MNLRGCVALVTGASRTGQAGEAVAAALLREGACLVLAARHAEGLRQVADGLAAPAGSLRTQAADLSREEEVEVLFRDLAAREGRVDILVHAAGGLTQYGPMESQSLAGIEAEWRSNFVTAFLVLRAGLPVMKRDGWGRAVLFTSAAVENPKPLMSAYLAAKTAVAALVRVAALEYAGTGVAVNAVAPTILDTGQNRREMGERGASQWVPLERMVKAVLRLADPGTHVESGQIITLV